MSRCTRCRGSGDCNSCDGGRNLSVDSEDGICTDCQDTGECRRCRGEGSEIDVDTDDEDSENDDDFRELPF